MRANDLNKCPRTKETQCQCESLHTINEAEETVKALVKFEHTEGDVQGIIKMKQDPGKPTIIRGLIKGLEPGEHGFHIHEFGDLSDGCASAGGHYNPDGVDHGDIDNGHVGDLGNITANEKGEARFKIVARRVDLSGDRSVVGRAVVVHADRDDLGKGGDEESLKTGNAGDRLGCGVIRLRQGIEEDYQRHVSDKHFNRNELPQIRKSDIKDSPFNFKQGTITLDKIKPVQSQRVDGLSKRAENMFFDGDYRPFILDKKGYLVNGHHRFDAANILGIDKVKAIIVDADIEELMKHFSHKVSDQAVMDSLQNKLTTMLTSEDASNCKHGKYFCSTDKVWKCRKKPKKKRVTEDMKGVLKKALDDFKKGAKEYKKAHDKKAEYNPLAHSKGSVFDPDRYKKPLPKEDRNLHPDKMTGNEMKELLDKKHAWDDGIHNPEFINDVRRHNWVLINNYPLAKLGSVEDPYNRIIDPDDDYAMRDSDLSEPIVIAPDRKSVMDGNHRVHKARVMGKTSLPAYFPKNIDENFADGKKKGKSRPGRVKKAGASCKGSVSSLRSKAKKYSGEKGKMYHWCANMKAGRKK